MERTGTGVRWGMRLFELGTLAPRQRGLRETAAPFLADLFEATRETVHLAVPDGVEVVYVQKIDSRQGPRCRRRTPRSVVAPGHLARDIALVAERGIAEEHEESMVGMACVAVAVLGTDGYAVAAVSAAGWANRLDTPRPAPAVRTAALGITRTVRGSAVR